MIEGWRYHNIKIDDLEFVKTLVMSGTPKQLLAFHDENNLSDYDYRCCATDGIKKHLDHWVNMIADE